LPPGEPALDLPLDDHRVDDHADVVRDGDIDHLHDAGLGVDLDLDDVGAAREREVSGIVERGLLEAGLHGRVREVVRHVRRERDLGERLRAIGALHHEAAVGELDVADVGLEAPGAGATRRASAELRPRPP